jgi:hypothetical protein
MTFLTRGRALLAASGEVIGAMDGVCNLIAPQLTNDEIADARAAIICQKTPTNSDLYGPHYRRLR